MTALLIPSRTLKRWKQNKDKIGALRGEKSGQNKIDQATEDGDGRMEVEDGRWKMEDGRWTIMIVLPQ